MIVDASAIVAVLLAEPDAEHFVTKIPNAVHCRMSVVNYLESVMVLEGRQGITTGRVLDAFIRRAQIDRAPVTVRQAELARDAWRRFGRGNHPAALNLGDCFPYALALDSGEPLLFKGDDFAQTGIPAA